MAESMSGSAARCPWCSALLPDPGAGQCPSCGAALTTVPDAPAEIKGVTTLDTEAILRARSEVARPQRGNRLLSFITGEMPVDDGPPADPASLAPPPDAVRREMLRLQYEAQQADRAAETVALKADELARRGIHVSELGGQEPGPVPGTAAEAEATPRDASDIAGPWPEELTPDELEPHTGP
jgi:hypothetical protein